MTRPSLFPRELARLLDGEAFGNNILAPGPGHSRKDRSLSVTVDPSTPYGIRVNTFAQDDKAACWHYVRERLGLASPVRSARTLSGADKRTRFPGDGKVLAGERDDAERTARALALWRESRPPAETAVEVYLARRGLALPDGAEEAIRYHAFCPFAGKRTPAMVALVTDIITNEPKAVHRTAITVSGEKVKVNGKDKMALGPVRGGAVKLTPDEEVTLALGIGEGIETTLSLRELPEFGASPVWSLISAGGVAAFPVLSGIEALWIAVDNDSNGQGQRAAHACADRWRAAGRL